MPYPFRFMRAENHQDHHTVGRTETSNVMDEDDNLPPPSNRIRRSKPSGTPMHPLALPPKKRICLEEIYYVGDDVVQEMERINNPPKIVVPSSQVSPESVEKPGIMYEVAPISTIDIYAFFEILTRCNWGKPCGLNIGPSLYSGMNVAAKFALCGDSSMHKILSNMKATELTPLTIHMGDFMQEDNRCFDSTSLTWSTYGPYTSRNPHQDFTLLDYLKPTHVRIAFHRPTAAFSTVRPPLSTWTDHTKHDYASMVRIISSLPSCVVSLEYPRDDACIGVSRLFNMICHNSSFNLNLERLVIGIDIIPDTSLSFENVSDIDRKLPALHTLIIATISEMKEEYGLRKLPHIPPLWCTEHRDLKIHHSFIPGSVRFARLSRYNVQLDAMRDAARFDSLRAHSISIYERVRNDYVIYQ